MSLPNTLNTNEIKNAAGTEVEFQRLSTIGRTTEFAVIGESPSSPTRLKIAHQEIGVGHTKRRRSVVSFELSGPGGLNSDLTMTHKVQVTADVPIGNISGTGTLQAALAYLMSFLATTGVGTTVLFDGTGNGAKALIEGSL
jgi:hypothetical protein